MYNDEPDYSDIPLPDEPDWGDVPLPDEPYDGLEEEYADIPVDEYEEYLRENSEEFWAASEAAMDMNYGVAASGPYDTSGLNTEQAEAVNTLEGVVQVVAGPGSGKTRVLTERLKHLLHVGADPRRILAVTFTKKAANEMKERAGTTGAPINRMWVTTFHGMCVRILKQEHARFKLPRDFTILDTSDTKSYMKMVFKELGLQWDSEVPGLISKLKNEYYYDFSAAANDDAVRFNDSPVMAVFQRYEEMKAENGVLDFDDLQILVVRLLEETQNEKTSWVNWFSHVHVDEYQDTNPVQERLTQLLAKGAKSLFIVGDADQSIYGFRGAVPGVMEDFSKRNPGAKQIILQDNYRSTPEILDAVKAVIAPNPSEARSDYVANRESGVKPLIMSHRDGGTEASYVVREIQKLIESGVPGGDIAVLSGMNSIIGEYEQKLLLTKIPYQISGKQKLMERAVVKDALAFFRAAVRPHDNEAIVRSLSLFSGIGATGVRKHVEAARKEGISTMARLEQVAEKAASKKKMTKADIAITEYLEAISNVRRDLQASGSDFSAVFDNIAVVLVNQGEEEIGLVKTLGDLSLGFIAKEETFELHRKYTYMADYPGQSGEGVLHWVEEDKQWVIEFISGAGEGTLFDSSEMITVPVLPDAVGKFSNINGNPSLASRFLDWCTLDANDEGDAEDKVVLSTVHSAKGREFHTVFVAAAEKGILPRQMDGTVEAEERRLMFVAISRAKVRLEIHWAEGRTVWGNFQSREPSEYLTDLADLCHVKGRKIAGNSAVNDYDQDKWW